MFDKTSKVFIFNVCCFYTTSVVQLQKKLLQDPELQQRYAVEVYNRFSALSEEEQDHEWPTFQDEVNDAAKTVLGFMRPSKNDCWHLKLSTLLTRKERSGCLAICLSTRHFVPNPRKAFFATSSSGPIVLHPRPKKFYNVVSWRTRSATIAVSVAPDHAFLAQWH